MQCSSLPRQIFKYMDNVPWCAVRCETPEGCKHCLRKFEAHPLEEHDFLTRELWREEGDHIQERAQGGDLRPSLAHCVAMLKTVPLDEKAGESVHSWTSKEKARAPASKQQHLKRTARRKGSFAHLRVFKRRYGDRGLAVLRHDWRTWKRIAQGNPHHRWRPVKPKAAKVLKNI